MARTILVIDDEPLWHQIIAFWLEGRGVRVLSATTLPEARTLFATHREELEAIFLDACMFSDAPNTLGLAEELSDKFGGPLVAMSSEPAFNRRLLEAGCTHAWVKSKDAPATEFQGFFQSLFR